MQRTIICVDWDEEMICVYWTHLVIRVLENGKKVWYSFAADQTLKGKGIKRFLYAVLKVAKRAFMLQPSSWAWLDRGQFYIISACTFQYPDFRLIPHDYKRLTNVKVDLFEKGFLTKDLMREKQWVGWCLVRRMVYAYLQEGLNNGTRS